MTPEEYIASGALELYALGALTGPEKQQAEDMLAAHAVVREELRLIEEGMESLAVEGAIQPPDHLKSALMSTVHESGTPHPQEQRPPTKTVTLWTYLTAASVAMLLISTALAFYYYNQWRQAESELTDLMARNERMAQEYDLVNERLEVLANQFEITNDPQYTRVELTGTENNPQASGYVFWNEQTKEVYLAIRNLQATATDQQFQLWAIIDGQPVNAGVFDAKDMGQLITLKNVSNASAFAITIEAQGGSDAPTLATMQVFGEV